jgi:hypothetical protein
MNRHHIHAKPSHNLKSNSPPKATQTSQRQQKRHKRTQRTQAKEQHPTIASGAGPKGAVISSNPDTRSTKTQHTTRTQHGDNRNGKAAKRTGSNKGKSSLRCGDLFASYPIILMFRCSPRETWLVRISSVTAGEKKQRREQR